MTGAVDGQAAGVLCRRVIRAADRAALATTAARGKGGVGGPWPYSSLVLAACDHDISPLLLISDLADHTRNLKADPRVSLLYDGTGGLEEPLAGPRVGLQGEAEPVGRGALLERYLRRHPSAEKYAGFADFHLFRVRPVRAHLVAGFGRIDWVEARDLVLDTGPAAALIAAETDILDRMNRDHGQVLDMIAGQRLGRKGSGWRMTGIDPEGFDLRRGGALARMDLDEPLMDPEDVPAVLARLAEG